MPFFLNPKLVFTILLSLLSINSYSQDSGIDDHLKTNFPNLYHYLLFEQYGNPVSPLTNSPLNWVKDEASQLLLPIRNNNTPVKLTVFEMDYILIPKNIINAEFEDLATMNLVESYLVQNETIRIKSGFLNITVNESVEDYFIWFKHPYEKDNDLNSYFNKLKESLKKNNILYITKSQCNLMKFYGVTTASRTTLIVPQTSITNTGSEPFFLKLSATNMDPTQFGDSKKLAFQKARSQLQMSKYLKTLKDFNFIDETVNLHEESGFFSIKGRETLALDDVANQVISIRSIDTFKNKLIIPLFALFHENLGKLLIEKVYAGNTDAYLKAIASSLGNSQSKFLMETGLRQDSPHGQNYLIELNYDFSVSKFVTLKDFSYYFWKPYLDKMVQMAGLEKELNPTLQEAFMNLYHQYFAPGMMYESRVDKELIMVIGFLHGSKAPSWMTKQKYLDLVNQFFVAASNNLNQEFDSSRTVQGHSSKGSLSYASVRYFAQMEEYPTSSLTDSWITKSGKVGASLAQYFSIIPWSKNDVIAADSEAPISESSIFCNSYATKGGILPIIY